MSGDNAAVLLAKTDEDFQEIVAHDARGEHVPALRQSEVLDRWQATLKFLHQHVDAQLEGARGQFDADTRDWRRAALTFRAGVARRLHECGALVKQRNVQQQEEQTRRARAVYGGQSAKKVRSEAGEAAVRRLIEAHPDEFQELLRDEMDRRRAGAA